MTADDMTPGELRSLMRPDGAADLLARSGLDVRSVSPNYVRIKPGELAVVGLAAQVRTSAGGEVRIEGYVRTYSDRARSVSIERKWSAKRPVPSAVGPGVQRLADGRSVAFWFPNDARLPHLKHVLRTDKLKRILGGLDGLEGERVRGRSTRVTAVRYKPERRWLGRVETRTDKKSRHLFVRLFADDRGARVNQILTELCAYGGRGIGPRPLGTTLKGRLSAEEALSGEELAATAVHGIDTEELADLVARCHATKLRFEGPARSALSENVSALNALQTLVTFEPDLAEPASSLARLLVRSCPESSHRSTLHGDLHMRQVLATPRGLRLVDFERAGVGEPLIDVGSMRAHLLLEGLDAAGDFGEEYARRTARRAAIELEFFTALGLVQRALLSFRNLEPDWRSTSAHAVELALELVHRSNRKSIRPEVLYPRPGTSWTGRAMDDEGREVFGHYDPDRRRFEPASPRDDPELPGLAPWLAEGELISYRPGRRAMVRCDDRFIKVLRPKKARMLNRRLSALTKAAGASGVVRGPVEWHEESGALVFRRCEGDSLHRSLMANREGLHEILWRVGVALASLHECRCDDPSALLAPPHVDTQEWVAVVASHFPRRAARYGRVAQLVDLLPIEASYPAIAHGDLHDKNVIVSNHGVELIDLDMAHVGSPVEDLGNLAAHLTLRALQLGLDVEIGSRWLSALVEGYEVRGTNVSDSALTAAQSRALFRLACLYLYRRHWTAITPVLLQEAEFRCQRLAA